MNFFKAKNPVSLKHLRAHTHGFTLVEVMISFTLFGLLVGVITGSLINVFRSHFYVFSTLNSQANLRFLLETMTREIKEGNNLVFDSEARTLSFANKDNSLVSYYLEHGVVYRNEGAETLPITSNDLDVLKFDVAGCFDSALCQPSVTLLLEISQRVRFQNQPFYLQTTITQRRVGV
ncbi:MAG: hypothetical protein A2418_01575 [Candidatus Brennerbacteria bacterium RIFOXYC1_FULL_41_11]|uniref:Prepilin-type N-terminal cleavage/methylation domain-containing protein n=1 Tax=Candidatus Brennerbacteria bacterium RIFOXYD1_FULL_41_16 TaxID=1797529 RepID=A0A1G1XJ13_9BACT|nr:MAG: hypothetical protein A2418_01575 [Candidatus Brennerbacteria bacterium RIFOXYC1_FULL_41_11]OGY39371.1 MAG: hypothetical protein A2391_02765 [Candidatus Brennerbacteria bacterium RIFOXYB1_FULL_41_13]OGY39998.1 MAG: hypothetical protein A2570_00715 [Candidatus Brennerbacteria bacterium RIFOXYD1_FULL_41_16]